MFKLLRVVSLSLALAACATTKTGVKDPQTLAAHVGVEPRYVELALYTAQGAFSGGLQTPPQREAAARAGVDQASIQALIDGNPLAAEQKKSLVAGLEDLL